MKIDILIKPGEDCSFAERILSTAARNVHVPVQINKTSNFGAFSHISVNPTVTPIIIIDGSVEFIGKNLDVQTVTKRLAEIRTR